MKKRVLLIAQGFYPEIGSAGNRIKNIFQLLEKEGYDVSVLTTEPTYPNKNLYQDPKFWDDESLNRSTKINRVKIKNRKYSRSLYNRLIYYIEMAVNMFGFILRDKEKYDVVFVSSPPIFVGFVGLFAKYKYKSRLILDIRDLWPESLKGVGVFNYRIILELFGFLEKLLYKKANHIIVNSMEFKDYILGKTEIKADRIGFMPNSAQRREIEVQNNSKDHHFKVIYTGNIGLAQDVDILKELALNLKAADIELGIIGYGMKKGEMVEFVNVNNLTNVRFYSPTTRKECFKINKEHHVGFVSLNNKKVFETVLPGKIIDYMTSGLPIVASVSGYAKRVIEEEQVGYVSESRDINEILGYIMFLYNNPKARKTLSQNAEAYIKDKFLWEKNLSELIYRIEVEES
jgi:glycosyltransferase involved in cell wall biosynthesis